jgi:hypothetical protein
MVGGMPVNVQAKALTDWEEHRFWLEVLSDHANFVEDHLSSSQSNKQPFVFWNIIS